ncbi:unnamed protein product [Sphagnum jensenii]|uniref:WD repeat-containing protein 74 n=1 Tax=Sphagnum jensenii TaxID=128206 RepID=A0ABP0VNQ9_9BRYO
MPRTSQVELTGCPPFRALCFDNLGLIKVVEAQPDKGAPQVVARWGHPDSQQAAVCTSLSGDTYPSLALARKNGRVEIIDPASGAHRMELGVPTKVDIPNDRSRGQEDASDVVCGLHLFKESSSGGKSVLTCTEKGVAAIQRVPDQIKGEATDSELLIANWSISESGCVLCLRVDTTEQHAAFGGRGLDVNLWDVEKCSRLWTAKSPRRDNLGLIAPPYVTSLTFLSNEDHRKLVVGTGHHQVRLYDVGGQRRPVLAFNFGESPIRALAADADGYSVYVGTGAGDLACFDMRTGQNLGAFKGKVAGSIRSVVRHPTLPIIASCGLDRYLRIHHSKTRQLLASVFLKQQLVSMVFDMSALPQEPAKTDATVPQEKSAFDDGRDDLDNSILHKVKSSKERKHTTFTESKSLGVSKKPRKSKSSELQDY